MRLDRWKATASVLGLLGLVLAAGGCTGSDPLQPTSTQFTIEVRTTNTSTRFDDSFFRIRQMNLEPMDPNANEALGVNPLGALNPGTVYEIDATESVTQFEIPVTLGTGLYRLESIVLDDFDYEDVDPPPSTDTCKEYITVYRPDFLSSAVLTNFGDVVVSVENSTENRLTITFDGQALLSAFQDGFFCVPQGQFGCSAPWCLFPPGSNPAYNPAALNDQAPIFLDFE